MNTTALPPMTRFSLTLQDHIAHLRLNRPERMNAMDPAFWHELEAVLDIDALCDRAMAGRERVRIKL